MMVNPFQQMPAMNSTNHQQQSQRGLVTVPGMNSTNNTTKKRKLASEDNNQHCKENIGSAACPTHSQCTAAPRRNFLRIPGSTNCTDVFQTEQWKSKDTALYLPVDSDVMLNTRNIEQMSFGSGEFFVADHSGTYCGARQGQVIHLWRFSEDDKKLYISRSLLITDAQTHSLIQGQLEEL